MRAAGLRAAAAIIMSQGADSLRAQRRGVIDQRDCLTCGAPLGGKYCGRCGQRNIAASPSAWELFGDAWQALAGYGRRFVRTVRALFRPG